MFGLVAGLDAIIVAVALLVALLAVSAVIRPLLVNVLSQAPFIGGWLSSNVDSGLGAFQSAITAPANASMGIISSALDWIANNGRAVLSAVLGWAGAAQAALTWLGTVALPQAISTSEGLVATWVDAAKAWTLEQVQALEVRLGVEIGGVAAAAAADTAGARADLGAAIQTAESDAAALVSDAERKAGDLFIQAEYDAGQLAAKVEQDAQAAVVAARQDLGAAVGAVEHDLQVLAEASRVALEDSTSILGGDIQAAEARANAALSGLESDVQKSINGILDSLPWKSLAAAVGAGEAMLQADVKTLVGLGAQEIVKAIGDAESIRARYGPEVRAALAQLRAR